jgi:hypothetical protein
MFRTIEQAYIQQTNLEFVNNKKNRSNFERFFYGSLVKIERNISNHS